MLDDPGDVSAREVAQAIQERAARFRGGRGMVVVIQDGFEVLLYYFDGISRYSWDWVEGQFSTDRLGRTFLELPPSQFTLRMDEEYELKSVLQETFRGHEMSVHPLHHVTKPGWDYAIQKAIHGVDCAVRISFG